MNQRRKFPRGTIRDLHINNENYDNDAEDTYHNSKYDVHSQFGYNQWNPQGIVYGYDQYGYYPEQASSYQSGEMAGSFGGNQSEATPVVQNGTRVKQAGKKKIKLEYITGRNKRNVTFSKRKKGIMKKAYELNVLTGTEILLLVASESGHVYTFATPKLRPIINDHENIIQSCLNAQDSFEYKRSTRNEAYSDSKEYSQNSLSDDFSG